MKSYKYIIIILIVFLKTGNVLSNINIFNVNNIEIEKIGKTTNEALANQAIKKAFIELIDKILLKEDSKKLKGLKFSTIKELVTYYQLTNKKSNKKNIEIINYNISFDKDKIHDLFYKMSISYSEITNKELFILPILKKDNQIYVYNQNFFYDNWNKIFEIELVEFILPLENIEVIQKINANKNDLLNLKLKNLFQEYSDKNLSLVLIEDTNSKKEKIYFKIKILNKYILKNIDVEKLNLTEEEFYKKIIIEVKKEITNLIKSQNLIDIRAPSFLNVQLKLDKYNNLVELKTRLNNDSVYLKIKFLGKLDKIIKQLENQKIFLKLTGDIWRVNII